MIRHRLLLAASFLTALFVVSLPTAHAFSDPTGTPPGGNVAAPLNVSSTSQTKTGDLTIQGNLTVAPQATPIGSLTVGAPGGASKLCLNGPAGGSPDCITSWSEVIGGSHFVNLFSGDTATSGNVDTGFARVQAGSNQDFAIEGISSAQAGLPRYGVAGVVSSAGLGDPLSYGVYGRGGGVSLAALFSGNVSVVNGKLQVGKVGAPAEICLYGSGVEECISKWTLAALNAQSASSDFVLVQRPSIANPDVNAQYGQVSLTGNANFGTVTLGEPTATTPITASCGDGLCSAVNGEDLNTCSQDCLVFTSGPSLGTVTNNSAVVSWSTNTPTTGRVEYGFTDAFAEGSRDDATLGTNHSITLTNLNLNKTYYFRVTALSPSGATLSSCTSGQTPSACQSFTTQNDNSAPSTPAKPQLNGSVAWNFVPLRWAAASDAESGVSGYEVYRRVSGVGSLVAITTVVEPFFNDSAATGLVKNTSYDYAVKAINGGGIKSAISPSLTVAVPNDIDIVPPSCPSGLVHTNPIVGEAYNAYYGSGQTRNFSWNKPGDTDLAGYNLYRKQSNSSGWLEVNSGLIDKDTLTYVDSDVVNRETNYDYLVVSVDLAGNSCGFDQTGTNFRTLATAPDVCDITNPAKQWGCPNMPSKTIFFYQTIGGAPITLTQQSFNWNKAIDDLGGAGVSSSEIWRVYFPAVADKDRYLTSCAQACLGEAAWNSTACTGVAGLPQPVQERIESNSLAGGPTQYLDTTLPAAAPNDKRGWTFSYCLRPVDNATPANVGKLATSISNPGPKRLPPASCTTDSQCSLAPNNTSAFPKCCNNTCAFSCGSGGGGGGGGGGGIGGGITNLPATQRPETPSRLAVASNGSGITVISPLSTQTATSASPWFRTPLRLLKGLHLLDLIPTASAASPVDNNVTIKKTSVYDGVVQATWDTQSLELGNAGRDIAASGKIYIEPHNSLSDTRSAFFDGSAVTPGSGLTIDAKTANTNDTVSTKSKGTGAGSNAVTVTQSNGAGLAAQFNGRVHVAGNLSASTKNAVVETSRGATYLYTLEAPEAKFLDEGSAQLVNGEAQVFLDPTFATTISQTTPYLVFLTPGAGVSQLGVTEKHGDRFIVHGRGTGSFTYRIVGTRAGFDGRRFTQ